MAALLDQVYVFLVGLVIPDGDGGAEILMGVNVLEMVLLAKIRVAGQLYQVTEGLFLVFHGSLHTFADLLVNVICKGSGQKRFDLHRNMATLSNKDSRAFGRKPGTTGTFFGAILCA